MIMFFKYLGCHMEEGEVLFSAVPRARLDLMGLNYRRKYLLMFRNVTVQFNIRTKYVSRGWASSSLEIFKQKPSVKDALTWDFLHWTKNWTRWSIHFLTLGFCQKPSKIPQQNYTNGSYSKDPRVLARVKRFIKYMFLEIRPYVLFCTP